MEKMDCTLEDYIDRNNANMAISQRKRIISQLLKGVEYIHSKSVFHRDLSPRNVLIKQYDDNTIVVKLSDFGLVKINDSELTSENSTIKGSLNDPTLKIKGFENYDFYDEIYALTLLVVFIMTGKTKFSSIKKDLVNRFMWKGTNSDRSQRFQSVDELRKGAFSCLDRL